MAGPMTDRLDYDGLRADTVRQVAKLMAAAAITAPKSGGQLFLAGKHLFIETVIVDDRETLDRLAGWMRARGKERREAIWFRDAEAAQAIDVVLFVGLADWYPPVYDCGACGYATCAEFLHATNQLRRDSAELEFVGPQCNLRDIDLGIAVGSAAKTAAIHSIDARCQTRIAVAARKLGLIKADIAVALSLTHKAIGFDRRMPEVDFDALDLPSTGTLPVGVPGAAREVRATVSSRDARPARASSRKEPQAKPRLLGASGRRSANDFGAGRSLPTLTGRPAKADSRLGGSSHAAGSGVPADAARPRRRAPVGVTLPRRRA
jgi:uncharacterized ferredoxin-like protein